MRSHVPAVCPLGYASWLIEAPDNTQHLAVFSPTILFHHYFSIYSPLLCAGISQSGLWLCWDWRVSSMVLNRSLSVSSFVLFYVCTKEKRLQNPLARLKIVHSITNFWQLHSFLTTFIVCIWFFFIGPDVFLLSARGKGAICQQPWREAPDQAAPVPAATTWQRGKERAALS